MHADNTRSDSTAVLDVYCGSYDIFENYRLEGRVMREQKHRLIRTFTAVALMFTAFFATLFGFLTLDRSDARAAGEAVGIRAQLQSGKDVYTGMTHAQLGDVLLVTLVDAEGQQVGDALEYDETGTDGFTVAGDISVASGSLSQSQRFTVTYGEYETSVNLTVQVNRIKEIKDIVFEPDETIYSNSDTYQMGSYITSFVGVNYAGEEIPLTSESIMMTGTFVPDRTTTYDGSGATFSKEMTVCRVFSVFSVDAAHIFPEDLQRIHRIGFSVH